MSSTTQQVALPVPPRIAMSLRAAMAQMIVMAIAALLTYLMRSQLHDAWIVARAAATDQSVEAVRESSVEAPHFAPVTVTLFFTYVMLAAVLVAMVRVGARWARYALTVLVAVSALVQTVIGTMPGVPVLLMLLTAVSVALHGLTLLFLWHPANTPYFRTDHNGRWAVVSGD